jgi:hypothetical protein
MFSLGSFYFLRTLRKKRRWSWPLENGGSGVSGVSGVKGVKKKILQPPTPNYFFFLR